MLDTNQYSGNEGWRYLKPPEWMVIKRFKRWNINKDIINKDIIPFNSNNNNKSIVRCLCKVFFMEFVTFCYGFRDTGNFGVFDSKLSGQALCWWSSWSDTVLMIIMVFLVVSMTLEKVNFVTIIYFNRYKKNATVTQKEKICDFVKNTVKWTFFNLGFGNLYCGQ